MHIISYVDAEMIITTQLRAR